MLSIGTSHRFGHQNYSLNLFLSHIKVIENYFVPTWFLKLFLLRYLLSNFPIAKKRITVQKLKNNNV